MFNIYKWEREREWSGRERRVRETEKESEKQTWKKGRIVLNISNCRRMIILQKRWKYQCARCTDKKNARGVC